ncbi:hypothetical protein FRC03_012303 [Tulasnella sp. 419]|nr:hypothetical protein FRC03_012303 [Tulasnella sp. 419]
MVQQLIKPPPTNSKTSSSSWAPKEDLFDDDDDGWQDMPVIRSGDNPLGLDEEDEKKYHYAPPQKISDQTSNARGTHLDIEDGAADWREKAATDESEYTRVRLDDDPEEDEAYLRTRYLFDEDKAMTPLSQMQATKNLLTEAQRIAYVALCSLAIREMTQVLKRVGSKELKLAAHGMELWGLKIMGRLYYHMELETAEQKMIEFLAEHGINAMDLVPSLMTTHTVHNPEYDPAEAAAKKAEAEAARNQQGDDDDDDDSDDNSQTLTIPSSKADLTQMTPKDYINQQNLLQPNQSAQVAQQTTTNIMTANTTLSMPGVSTSLSSTDENVTLDIRWTVLCDLFLILIADSVYDARSRVLLENVAAKLGLTWLDVVKFEKRVTDALEIQEGVEKLEQKEVLEGRELAAKKRRYVMMGLATIGGGLVIGLSAGLLAPVIGAGLGAALGTIGITGTTGFLAGAGGAAVITTGGVLTGSGIAVKGMARRTQQVRTFELLPVHNNKRVNCIITIPGFMSSRNDDVRLPWSVLDPVIGDVFSVLWEPEMMGETGNALRILTSEVLTQVGQTVLQATVMTALMSALQWPLVLTKLGYLIDNPWSNALDRAKAAGLVLADVLLQRAMGVRPITLMGFSLGARVIFYALLELHRHKAFGIVQDVFLFGATVTAPTRTWHEARGAVSGRFVNCFARNDWLLNYLFRATSGGLNTVAGLRPVDNVAGLENVDVTDKINGHMSYRPFMPVILDQLGFPVSATYFDEPEDLEALMEESLANKEEAKAAKPQPKGRLSSLFSKKPSNPQTPVSRPPTVSSVTAHAQQAKPSFNDDDDLPAREEKHGATISRSSTSTPPSRPDTPKASPVKTTTVQEPEDDKSGIPKHAGFDFDAIGKVLGKDINPDDIRQPIPRKPGSSPLSTPLTTATTLERSESAPPPTLSQIGSINDSPDTPKASAARLPAEDGSSVSASHSYSRSANVTKSSYSNEDSDSSSYPYQHQRSSTWNASSAASASTPSLVHSSSNSISGGFSLPGHRAAAGNTSETVYSNPFISSQESLSFGGPNASIVFGGTDGSISSGGGYGGPSVPTLSFGTPDGDISTASSPFNDPWDSQPLSTPWASKTPMGSTTSLSNGNSTGPKRKGSAYSSFNSNPWS